MIQKEQLREFLLIKTELLGDLYFGGTETDIFCNKCIGPVPVQKTCNAKLSKEINYNNVYCWNCLYNHALKKGVKDLAKDIADNHL